MQWPVINRENLAKIGFLTLMAFSSKADRKYKCATQQKLNSISKAGYKK